MFRKIFAPLNQQSNFYETALEIFEFQMHRLPEESQISFQVFGYDYSSNIEQELIQEFEQHFADEMARQINQEIIQELLRLRNDE